MKTRNFLLLLLFFGGMMWLLNFVKSHSTNFKKHAERELVSGDNIIQPKTGIDAVLRADVATHPAKIQPLRSQFQLEIPLNIIRLPVHFNDQGYLVSFAYEPIESGCFIGEIDLIKNLLGKDGKLIWIWEDEQGKAISPPRVVTTDTIATPFKDKIVLPFNYRENRYFRYSLCSSSSLKSCHGTQAADYSEIGFEDESQNVGPTTFFSQSFRVDSEGLKIFDSRIHQDQQKYFDYLQSDIKYDYIIEFIVRMIELQRKNAALPVHIKDKTLILNLSRYSSRNCT